MIKIGDVFILKIKDRNFFFQFIGRDSSCLNADVIRIFDLNLNKEANFKNLILRDIQFYSHTSIRLGIKLNLWKKIGNLTLEDNFISPTFRHTDDVANPSIKKSYRWYIWKVNGPTVDVGELTKDLKLLSVGGVTHPYDIVTRLETGKDMLDYPD
jgi:Immunity protein 26